MKNACAMDKATKIRRVYAMLGRLNNAGARLTKEDLVADATGGQTTRLSQLTAAQWGALWEYTASLMAAFKLNNSGNPDDRKRKRVISHLKEAGYILPNGRADMEAIEAWVRKQKHGKRLNAHSGSELSDIIYAAEKVKQHYLGKT